MSRIHLLLTLGAISLLTSCETTGDPNQGGLFGWSQSKANQRIDERERHLEYLDRENAYQRGRSSALEDEEARRKAELRRAQQ
ncbi:MAG: hypothetical protein RL693_2328 [Verrucomicrobiota bacterium]|jgi:hypothetical protein